MTPELNEYDNIIVAFSGGKDSIACFLHLLEQDVEKEKIELWHHCIDGEGESFMDWPCTEDYCKTFAEAFDVDYYRSWKTGGFKREMLRENQRTASTKFETPNGIKETGGNRGNKSTRRKFPQVSANLNVRWCSAYLKIDVGATAIRNQKRFRNTKTLFITGERAQESKARAHYEEFEPHRSDLRDGKRFTRHVDHWRPIHGWLEEHVWQLIEKHKINVHPAYHLGWGRVSCATCIFASPDQWASASAVLTEQFNEISDYEKEFDHTIRQDESVEDLAERGETFDACFNWDLRKQAKNENYNQNIILDEWTEPAGAYGDSAGPI